MSSTPAPETSAPDVARLELSADALEALAVDTPLLPSREPLGARLASYFGRHLLLLFWVSFGALWAILSSPSPFNRPDFAPGQSAPRDYVAPQNAFLPDRTETARRRNAAAALVPPAYDPAPGAQAKALALLHETAQRWRRAASLLRREPGAISGAAAPGAARSDAARSGAATSSASLSGAARDSGQNFQGEVGRSSAGAALNAALQRRFAARAGWKAAPALMPTLRDLSDARWRAIEGAAESAVRAAYLKARLRSDVGDDARALRPLLRAQIAKRALSSAERAIALPLAMLAARFPNVVVNRRATAEARQDAASAVLPVFLRVEANTPLVREGERVTGEQFAQLQELGLIAPRFRLWPALAHGALCLLLVSGAAFYLARARRDLVLRPAALWLIAVVPVAFVGTFRALMGVPHADFMMVPLTATAAMLLTVLLDPRVGLPAGFIVAALCALLARVESGLFLAAILSAWIGALSVAQLSSRFALLRCVALLTVCNAILAFSLGVLRESSPEEMLSSAAWSALAGAASVLAMAGLAIFIERPFGITSHLRLLELLAPDEVVIQRMQLEAPGTYTHSMTVALLAEAGAKAVGADPLMCRVAGLYHDIGKLRRPHCFIENQSGDNIHDRLSPQLSALLIKAHVKDGLELGRAIRLPIPILEIVASHHGTGVIAYFLHRARQLAETDGARVEENVFRYPGPKPRSREAAIVMLADSIEASARALPQITPEILDAHVQSLIAARLSEGQLDECDLSLREMGGVREAFAGVLRGVLHGRIAYPDTQSLSGALNAPTGDWVRKTLGDEAPRGGRNAAKPAAPVAAAPQKKQNKAGRNKTAPSASVAPATAAPSSENGAPRESGTKIEGTGAAFVPPAASSGACRRFKPPFHAPGHALSHGTPVNGNRQAPKSPGQSNGARFPAEPATQPDVERRRAPRSARSDSALANGALANGATTNGATTNGSPTDALDSNDGPTQENGAPRDSRDAAQGDASLSGVADPAANP